MLKKMKKKKKLENVRVKVDGRKALFLFLTFASEKPF